MKTILLCLIGFVCLVASQSCNCPQNQTLQLATFNTLQIPLATARTERREAQIEFFMNRSADIDILCLQELWEPVDRQFFISNLSSIYPYHVSGQPINSTCTAPCSENDMSIILTCANSITCLQTTTGFDFLSCIQTQCQLSPNVSSTCSQCLSGLDSGLSAQSKLHTCGGLRNVTNDTDTSCQFLFDGETDNLLLSKYPIIANDTLYYSISPFTSWSVTYAKINTTSQGIVNVFCTHVVASQPFIDLSQENFNETAELLQFIANKTQNESNPAVFVMGDFNFGPETDNLTAEFPDSYWAIRNANFSDTQWLYANLTGTPLNCTYCSANPLATFGTHDRVIDHIFVYNNTKVCIKGVEIFGKELNVLTADNTTVTLSDHYGLRAWYCPSNTTIGQSGTNNTTTGGTGVSTTGGTTSGGSTTSEATTGTEPPVPGWATTGSSSASTISVTGILVASIVGLVLAI